MDPVNDAANKPLTSGQVRDLVNTPLVQFMWHVAKVLAGALITGSICMGVSYIKEMRDDLKQGSLQIQVEAKAQAITEHDVQDLKTVTNETAQLLRTVSDQTLHNTDDIKVLQEREAEREPKR